MKLSLTTRFLYWLLGDRLYHWFLRRQLKRIDRTGPTFKYACHTCGRPTTSAGYTYLCKTDGLLYRSESKCIDCLMSEAEQDV